MTHLCVNEWNVNPSIANQHAIHICHTVHLIRIFLKYNIPACVFALFLESETSIHLLDQHMGKPIILNQALLTSFSDEVLRRDILLNPLCQRICQTCAHMFGYQLI